MKGVEERPDRWGQISVWLHSCWSAAKTWRKTSTPLPIQLLEPIHLAFPLTTRRYTVLALLCGQEYKEVNQVGHWVGHKTTSGFNVLCRCVKAGTSHKWISQSQDPSTKPRPKKNWAILAESMWSVRPNLTWHVAAILCWLSKKKRKINATCQHYIKSFCALIFSFLPLYFCLGCRELFSRPRGSRASENNVGTQGGNCTCCLFSAVSATTPKASSSLQTISYVNIIPQRRLV